MEMLNKMYGSNLTEAQARINSIKAKFIDDFGQSSQDLFSASGRIELLGNHTDHNHGLVLVGAISRDIISAVSKRTDGKVVIKSEGFSDINISTDDLQKRKEEEGKSSALVRGVLKALSEKGVKCTGFNASLTSNIFKGAGVSSSAAYEVLIAKIISYYFAEDKLTAFELAQASQYAESVYFGKPCGLLDQSGIAFGGINFIDFCDITKPKIETLVPDFKGYKVVLTNTGGDHSKLTPEYAQVKNDMHNVSGYFGKKFLREISEEDFYKELPDINKKLGGRPALRAIHFFEENKRVLKAVEALKGGQINAFLEQINNSGESSYKLLQNCYVGGDNIQGIPLALALSKKILNGRGACRVHGGGFAGTIIAFVPDDICLCYTNEMKRIFGEQNVAEIDVRAVGAVRI